MRSAAASPACLCWQVFDETLFENLAERCPECAVIVAIRELAQHVEYTLCQGAAHGRQLRVLLQQFARHVQWQVSGINDAFDEAEIQGQELLGIVHDEDALYIEFQATRCLAVPEIEWRGRRNVEQARVFALALDTIVAPGSADQQSHVTGACRIPCIRHRTLPSAAASKAPSRR